MINKIGERGRDIGGLVAYLFGPGRSDEHHDQRVIAADVRLQVADGTRLSPTSVADRERVSMLGRLLDNHRRLMRVEPTGGWVWHCAISLPQGETLSDEQWAVVARAAVDRLGFGDAGEKAPCRWIAVHHGPSTGGNDHIHLAVNLVRTDGSLADPGRDRRTMSRLCADMERQFGLFVVEGRTNGGLPGLSRAELERAHRRRTDGPGRHPAEPERIILARKVRAAAAAAGGEAEFVRRLKGSGVWARPRYASGGRREVVGYSVTLAQERTGDRAAGKSAGKGVVWFGGGRLAADLTLPKLRQSWAPSSDVGEALAEWSHHAELVTAPGNAERPITHAHAFEHAAQLLDGIRLQLADLPADDPRWTTACRGAAAAMAALALRTEVRPGALAGLADSLAFSAQDQRRARAQANRAQRQMRGDFAAVVRVIGQAARTDSTSAAALLVIVAALLLANTISDLHRRRHQPHHERILTDGAGKLAGQVAGLARPHGRVPTARLRALSGDLQADIERLVDQERRIAELTEAARAGRGPMATALHEGRAKVEAAAAAEQALPAAREAIERQERHLAAVEQQITGLKGQAGQGRLTLRLQGTSREQVQEELKGARQERGQARAALGQAHTDLNALIALAAAPYNTAPGGRYGTAPRTGWREGAAGAAHQELATNWEVRWEAAVADDVATAPRRARLRPTTAQIAAAGFPRPGALPTPRTTTQAHRQLQAIHTELALRQALPAEAAQAEKTARAYAPTPAAPSPSGSPALQQRPRRDPPQPDRGQPGRGR